MTHRENRTTNTNKPSVRSSSNTHPVLRSGDGKQCAHFKESHLIDLKRKMHSLSRKDFSRATHVPHVRVTRLQELRREEVPCESPGQLPPALPATGAVGLHKRAVPCPWGNGGHPTGLPNAWRDSHLKQSAPRPPRILLGPWHRTHTPEGAVSLCCGPQR